MNAPAPGRLLRRYITCRTWREYYEFLRDHPVLLTTESAGALRQMEEAATSGGHQDAAEMIERARYVLERGVAQGLDLAFCAQGLSWLCLPDPVLVPLADQVIDRLRTFHDAGDLPSLNRAIDAAAAVLGHASFGQAPGIIRAAVYFDAGFQFWMRYEAARDPADLGEATARWQRALDTAGTRPPAGPAAAEYVKYLTYYLMAHADWARRTGRVEALDEALGRAGEAIRHNPAANGPDGAGLWLAIGRVWRERAQRTGDPADAGQAVSAAETALRLWPDDDEPGRAAAWQTLGSARQDRYLMTGSLADLDAAFEAFQEAVSGTPESAGPDALASRLTTLANALRDRYRRTGRADDLDAAIEHRRKILEITPADDPLRWGYLANMGDNLRERFLLSQRPADIAESVASYEAASLETGRYSADDYLTCTNGLAASLRARFVFGHERADLERAIALYESLLDQVGPSRPDRGAYLANLANALWDRSRAFGTGEDARRAAELYRSALRSPLSPELAVITAKNMIGAATKLGAWDDVADAALAGLRAVDQLVQTQLTRGQKEAWLRDAKNLSSSAAFALARTGREDEALVALETGRARLLSEVFEPERAGRPPPGAAMPPDLVEEIVATAGGIPLVYVAAADAGGLALIVTGSPRSVRTVWLPLLSRAELVDRLIRYMEVLAQGSLGTDLVVMDQLGQWLWEAVAGPVLAELAPGAEPTPAEIVLIPAGWLALVPLHAAWRPDAGAPGQRVYLIDECAVTYAANARARQTARTRAARLDVTGYLVVEDPQPTSAGPLDHAAAEADAVLADVPGLRLRHEEATGARVRPALRTHSVLHFACHGSARPGAPLDSRLILAHDESLTLGELMADQLGQARLAVLSACETAVVGSELMDEVVNFPTGMLQAGAAACIGSLWPVSDTSTALLMRRFYELWRGGGIGPSEALRQAQRWLRDLSNEELLAYAPTAAADADVDASPGPVRDFWLKARSYYHPFYWAAFAFYGA